MDAQFVKRVAEWLPVPDCYKYSLSGEEWEDCVHQMILDLTELAHRDGCIAAAWALSMLEAAVEKELVNRPDAV